MSVTGSQHVSQNSKFQTTIQGLSHFVVFFFQITSYLLLLVLFLMIYTIKMKDNKNFVSLFKKGKYVCGKACVVYYKKNGTPFNKLGISTGKKTGNAVMRSRCRRIIRQAYRENEADFPRGCDIVIVSRAYACQCKSTEISRFLKKKVIPQMKSGGNTGTNAGNGNKNGNNKRQN